jgi:hypothetical protein
MTLDERRVSEANADAEIAEEGSREYGVSDTEEVETEEETSEADDTVLDE